MHYLLDLALRILWIYGGIALGYVMRFLPKSNKIGKILTFIGLNILTPLLLIFVIVGLHQINSIDWLFFVLASIFASLFSMIIDLLLLRNRMVDDKVKGAEISVVTFMNSLFYPFPIIIGLIGIQGLFAASIWVIAGIVLRNSFGVVIGLKYGKGETNLLKIIKDMILFPPTIGVIIGFILRFTIGYINTSNISAIAVFRDFTTFLMLVLVGISFSFPKKEEWKSVAVGRSSIARFGGGIIAVIAIIFTPIGLEGKIPLIIQALSPPAVNNIIYARWFKLDDNLTSRLIAVLTLIALILLPFEILGLSFLPLLWN